MGVSLLVICAWCGTSTPPTMMVVVVNLGPDVLCRRLQPQLLGAGGGGGGGGGRMAFDCVCVRARAIRKLVRELGADRKINNF